jgi:pyridinium-3,5-bisthiocarboxylic acid mononucleotide nickel chelatase
MTRLAWIDASHGIAGDMLLGALIDAGVPLETLQDAVELVIPETVRLVARPVIRAGMRGMHVVVELLRSDQPRRDWAGIDALITQSRLEPRTAQWARATFRRIAEAEARAHGVSLDEVQFHEIGAWDSIADIVGVCAGLAYLGVETIVAGPVALGSGTVPMAHGDLAVPGPAVIELARGWPTLPGPEGAGELTTPTGMALLGLGRPGPMPAMIVSGAGTGAGSRDIPGHANTTRIVIGAAEEVRGNRPVAPVSADMHSDAGAGSISTAPPAGEVERRPGGTVAVPGQLPVVHDRGPIARPDPTAGAGELTAATPAEHGPRTMLECTVDDLDPRLWPGILDLLVEAGADDAWLVPVIMRKGRPGHILQVLARPDLAEALRVLIYRHTTTLGIRSWEVLRDALHRDSHEVDVEGQVIRVKRAWRGELVTMQPEYADVAAAASALDLPEREVLRRAAAQADTL